MNTRPPLRGCSVNLNEAFTLPVLDEGVDDLGALRAVCVIGGGGSGKTTLAQSMFTASGLKFLNADTHLERFMKQAKVPLADVGLRYDLFRKARELRDKELEHYAARRLGIVLDLTGWDYSRVAGPVNKLKALGYDVSCVFVTTSLDTSFRRNDARADAGGRRVPDSYVKDAWQGAHQNAGKYLKLFGPRDFFVISNDTDLPPDQFEKIVIAKADKIARTILARPLRNPVGVAWLQQELVANTLNSPKTQTGASEPVRSEVVICHQSPY